MSALAVAFASVLPLPAAANALASASLDIVSFSWYRDVNNDGNTANDVVITTGDGQFSSANTYQFAGNDNVAAARIQPPPGDVLAPPQVSVTAASNSTGQLCAPGGSGCTDVSGKGFGPLTPPTPTVSFYNAEAERNGQFVRSLNDPTTGSLSGGIRADVSLTENATVSAQTFASWTLSSSARVTGINNTIPRTYFRLEFEAHRLAETLGAERSASADLFMQVSFQNDFWTVIDTAGAAGGGVIPIPTDPVVYSFDTQGFYSITSTGSPIYSIGVVATASASGSTTAVPLAPTPLLLATGLVWLVARRAKGEPCINALSRSCGAAALCVAGSGEAPQRSPQCCGCGLS